MRYDPKFREVSDEEWEEIMRQWRAATNALWDAMPLITYERYREEFSKMFDIIDGTQHYILPNTGSFEDRAKELWGDRSM